MWIEIIFLNARQYLKNWCEEYKLNIDNGEMDYLEKAIDDHKKCTDLKLKKELELKIRKLKDVLEFRKNGQLLTDDNGAIGVSYICSVARPKGDVIYLSGSGADEIFSDYGYQGIKHYNHSTIGGYFPLSLETVFPWKNFLVTLNEHT